MPGVNVAINRRDSVNRKLAHALLGFTSGRLAGSFVQIDDLPMYNQDLESPLPAGVARFKASVQENPALLIASPEHNRSIPAVLKDAFDWGARPGTSPGGIDTPIAQHHLRQVLGSLGALVMGGEAFVTSKPNLIRAAL
jgi:chromate reductase